MWIPGGSQQVRCPSLERIWINASPRRYVEAVKDIEHFGGGETFMITRNQCAPKVDDYADSQLPEEDFTDPMLYASHYFWTAIELRVLVADPSRGTTSGSSQSIAADPTV